MVKDRTIEEVSEKLGKDFFKVIDKKIKENKKVKILDAGCGYGIAMLGLIKKYKNKIDICGFNYSSKHGNREVMIRKAIEKKIFTKEEIKKIKLPNIYYFDASKKWPFKKNSFDFIYSKSVLYLIDDKIKFLEECNRVLNKDGIAKIDSAFWKQGTKKLPKHYSEFWEVFDKGRVIKIEEYLKKVKGIKVFKNFIEIEKQPKLDFKLEFISSIDYNFLWTRYLGVKSIYTTQLKFKPHWRR